eukprot:1137080-Amphidinium_carterae.1
MAPKLVGKLAESLSPKKKKMKEKEKESRRQLHRRSIDEQVDRAISYHFPEFTSTETDGRRNSDGKTLREVMTAEREKQAKSKSFRFGQKFIAEQRRAFASELHISKILQVKNQADRVSEELVNCIAMAGAKDKTKRKKTPLYAYLQTCPSITQKELVGLLRHCHETQYHLLSGRDHLMKIAAELVEKEIPAKFPDEIRVLAGHFDGMLAMHFAGAKKQRMLSEAWWDSFGYLTVLLPEHTVFERLMTHVGECSKVADDIEHVTNHTKLGAKLFANTHTHSSR